MFDFKEGSCAFLYLTAAEFAFDHCVSSVIKMQHGICLQPETVMIIRQMAAQSL